MGNRSRSTALHDHISGAAFAASALGGDSERKLDFVKAHSRMRVACDFTIRNPAANTDNHGSRQLWLAIEGMKIIINENSSHSQLYFPSMALTGLYCKWAGAAGFSPRTAQEWHRRRWRSPSRPWPFPVRRAAGAAHGRHRPHPHGPGPTRWGDRPSRRWRPGPWP